MWTCLCEQHTSHVTFSRLFTTLLSHIDIGSRCVAHFISSHPCAHVVCCLILSDLLLFAFHHLIFLFSFSWSSSSYMWVTRTLRTLAHEESGTMAENTLTVYEYHSSSSSSSRSGLWSEFTICEESFLEFFEEVIQRNWKIDQEPDRDHWCINDWLRRLHMERDKLAVWQNSSDLEC